MRCIQWRQICVAMEDLHFDFPLPLRQKSTQEPTYGKAGPRMAAYSWQVGRLKKKKKSLFFMWCDIKQLVGNAFETP